MAKPKPKRMEHPHPWPYGSATDCIAQLEKEGQPWAVARYPVSARGISDEARYFYEVILFQTYEADDPVNACVFRAPEFRELRAAYGLRAVHKSNYGAIYARDNGLRNLMLRFHKGRRPYECIMSAARSSWQAAANAVNGMQEGPEREAWRQRRDLLREDIAFAQDELNNYDRTFIEKNNLIIYKF